MEKRKEMEREEEGKERTKGKDDGKVIERQRGRKWKCEKGRKRKTKGKWKIEGKKKESY